MIEGVEASLMLTASCDAGRSGFDIVVLFVYT